MAVKNGVCVKCNSSGVRIVDLTGYDEGIPIGTFAKAGLIHYICTNCGYVETYVPNRNHLAKIAKSFPPVDPEA